MRIAVVNAFFPPRAGGSAHLSEAVARHCAEAGHEVMVITSSFPDAPPEETVGGLRVVRLPGFAPTSRLAFNYDIPFAASPRNIRRAFRLLDEFAPDVVHQHGQFFDLTWMSTLWARRRHVPVVLSVHTRLISPSRLHGGVMAAGDLTVVRALVRASRPWVVAVDGPVHTYVRARYGIAEDHVVDIPVGVETDRFTTGDGATVRDRLGIGDRPTILSLGHVIPLRDRLALVEAMPRILEKVPDVAVVVVGHVYDDRFERRAKELGVDGSLIVTGAVPKHEVPDFAAAADVEAHDLQDLGFGTASLEMLAAGVPVVTTALPDNYPTGRLVDGENVLLARAGDLRGIADAFVRLLDDPALRRQVGEGGRRLIEERFSMEAVTAAHLDLYERAIAENRP
ncbi:glycosyltransferase family 4 protein [Rhabdothermincola salaria]|uniref:glycosyltransferase family 4 protein n=1 Tax=Rhabdothermincola salaria TaxID=2903142 RepID=UPI001E4022E6|nr:glycosyltransferase family 4 protein [Rhabdothermincola salaria]